MNTAWFTEFWVTYQTPIHVVLILLIAIIGRALLLVSVRRVVSGVVSGVKSEAKAVAEDTESPLAKARVIQRTKTIGSVLSNFITWGIALITLTMVLNELGVQVGALIAGAGILGAAVGFGAQSLVRDLISGLFIVFEDQYGVGDVVDLGEVKGAIEAVGLRVTQVRDVEGTLWYVRNGEISRVGNKSQGFTRVIVDLSFEPSVDFEKAKALLLAAAAKVSKSKEIAGLLIGAAEVWGIQSLSGDELVIRLVQQVSPKGVDQVSREIRAELALELKRSKLSLASSGNNFTLNLKK
ncbi:MAG: mechanosensitive ion channel [Rhodoluna sp.]|nr:mechanosensitive ion channel [Rhodoluna sp.]